MAAQWGGYRYTPDFLSLPVEEQCAVVASYRASGRIQHLIDNERAKDLRRRQQLDAALGKAGKSE